MKIYLPKVSIRTVCIDKTAVDVTCNIRNITEIYCLDGIYESEGSKIKRIKINDVPSEKTTFKGIDIIIDKSILKYNSDITNIEANSHIRNIERCEYGLRRNAKILLIIEKQKSKIKQIYFETNEDINNFAIAEDFTTLLSLFS